MEFMSEIKQKMSRVGSSRDYKTTPHLKFFTVRNSLAKMRL